MQNSPGTATPGTSTSEMLRQISLNSMHIQDIGLYGEKSYTEELQQLRDGLQKSSQAWQKGFDLAGSPLPMLIPQELDDHLRQVSSALNRAIASIVERWFDPKSKFTERMPLLPHQEAVLEWIDGPGKHFVKPFKSQAGVWRPDFLVREDKKDIPIIERVQICEINARFAFNGSFATAYVQEVFNQKGLSNMGLKSPVVPEEIYEAYKTMLDPTKPVHILKGREPGLDIHLYQRHLEDCYGMNVRFIKPEHLRLVMDDSRQTVFCKSSSGCQSHTGRYFINGDGEKYEKIYQVALELHQSELQDLGQDMLKALALICFNDLRSIYIVHDKRLLGIILEELPSLVHKHKALSAEEARLLKHGIVRTILPGSQDLENLIRDTQSGIQSKDSYLLKPVGSGKGNGIIFGSEIVTQEEWLQALERLSQAKVGGSLYVVQPIIDQAEFKVIIPENDTRSAVMFNNFVGTFMMIDSQYLGLGNWRTAPNRICAVSHGGTWVGSVMATGVEKKLLIGNESNHSSKVTRINVINIGEAQDAAHVSLVNQTLVLDGIMILDLGFDDPESNYLAKLIDTLHENHGHGRPLTHSSTRGAFWDVKPDIDTKEQHVARSETMEDFPWHTDCSYDSEPPTFFALQVLQSDRYGGGTLSVMKSSALMDNLSNQTVDALCSPNFRIMVPPEFMKDTESIVGCLMIPACDSTPPRFRYRADIIEALTPRAKDALEELKELLATAKDKHEGLCVDLTPDLLPNRSIVLLDNHRWLHSRNIVKDSERHLKRIRWDARKF